MYRMQSLLVVALFVGLTQSWDIAVSAGNRLEFYTSDGVKTETVHFNYQNLTTLAYDEVHNVMLYVDKHSGNDTICGYNIASAEYKCYIERIGRNIQGLVFDPVTELLFFTDTKERSINWFAFKPGFNNNVFGNLLIKLADGIPSDIAVDSCRGYVYWINRKLRTSLIERIRFNGSGREVVINANELDLHGLTICQQTKKIYWVMPENGLNNHMFSADLNGNNRELLADLTSIAGDIQPFVYPNILSVSNKYVFYVDWCLSCTSKRIWKFPKPVRRYSGNYYLVSRIQTQSVVGIATNYKVKDQFQGISECNQVPNNYEKHETNDSFKVARESEGPFCDHGIKVSGQSFCKCTPGYTGARCDVSVCGNYCLKGDCSINEEGLPKCRCNAGYSGQRCEVNDCHGYCLNNGICSLNEEDEAFCECVGEYEGERCDVPVRLNDFDGCQCNGSQEADQNNTSSKNFLEENEGNLTLNDLLASWRKHAH